MILFFSTLALAADCSSSTTAADLRGRIGEAQAAFVAMDLDRFEGAQHAAAEALTCLNEPLEPADAAAYHGLRALVAFVAEDEHGTLVAYHAAHRAWSLYTLDPSLAPEGHPLRAALEQARLLPESAMSPLQAPPRVVLRVDGAPREAHPTERPYTLQASEKRDQILHTDWLPSGSPPPAWSEAPLPLSRAPRENKPVRTALLVGAGSSMGAAAGLYGAAWATRATFFDPNTPLEDLSGVRKTTNGATVGAIALGVTGLALGTTVWVIQW